MPISSFQPNRWINRKRGSLKTKSVGTVRKNKGYLSRLVVSSRSVAPKENCEYNVIVKPVRKVKSAFIVRGPLGNHSSSIVWNDKEYFYPPLDEMLIHHRVAPGLITSESNIKLAGSQLYTLVERSTVKESFPRMQQNDHRREQKPIEATTRPLLLSRQLSELWESGKEKNGKRRENSSNSRFYLSHSLLSHRTD